MSTDTADTPNSSFVQTIDLTQRAQRKKNQEASEFSEPDPPLDEVTLDTLPDIVEQVFRAAGWTELMPVQEKAIPYMLERRDLIVQSRTGSGKTGAFLLPMFDLLDASRKEAQVLILTPTRELARQVYEEFERMKIATPETNELDAALLYGGVSYKPQIDALKGGAQFVAGTPGRTLDHIKKGNFKTDTLDFFILDEADEMLSMGFYPDMKDIEKRLPKDRNSYMFSATMPPKVRSMARQFLRDPGFLSLSSDQVHVENIDYRYYLVPQMKKDQALARLIEEQEPMSSIIFANTKRDVSYVTQFLQNHGYDADEMSGDLSQKAREKAMGRLRKGDLRFLVATDVAARGIDISDLDCVFMYDVPQDREYFIHRAGRTARAGKSGTTIVLATHEDEFQLIRTAKRYGIDIERHELPEPELTVDEQVTDALAEHLSTKDASFRDQMHRFTDLVKHLADERPNLLTQLVEEVAQEAGIGDEEPVGEED
jgi:ATP-dependent RNA helicase DeaD